MVSQKLVTLSALVLIMAVMSTNAGKDKAGKLAMKVLCAQCPAGAASDAISKLKNCLTAAKVDLSTVTGTGQSCMDSLKSNKDTALANADKTKLGSCFEDFSKDFKSNADLKSCLKGAKGNSAEKAQ